MANKNMKWFSIATLACAASLCVGFGAANLTADAEATELEGFAITATSVRIEAPSGLRFKVDLPADVEKADVTNAYTAVTLIPEAGALAGQAQTTNVPATVWRTDNSGWNTVLLEIPETDYVTEVTAQAFVTIDGVEYQTEAVTSSIAKTAKDAIANELATEEEVGDYIQTEEGVVATFEFGANGAASHYDGSSATSYNETNGGYTLDITGAVKMSTGVRDAKGNSAIRFGTSSEIGSMSFTVPTDVSKVILYVAQYKANATKITINGGATQTVTTASNNGEYTAYEVDTSTSKTVSFATVSGGARCVINTIEFVGVTEKVPFYTTKVNAAKAAVADLFANEYSANATVAVPVEAPYGGTFAWNVEAGAEAATIDGDQVSIKQSLTEDVTVTISATYTQDGKTLKVASETFDVKKMTYAQKKAVALNDLQVEFDGQYTEKTVMDLPTANEQVGGVIAWSSNSDYAVIDQANDTITIAETRPSDADAEITITATYTVDGITEVLKTFDFKVLKQGGNVVYEDVALTLSFASTANRVSQTTAKQVWSQNGITFTNNKGSGNNVANYSNPVRLYQNSEIVIDCVDMKKIVFDCNNSTYATALKNSIGSPAGATVTVSSDKVTVTFTSAVSTFKIAKLTAQVRMDSITVTASRIAD